MCNFAIFFFCLINVSILLAPYAVYEKRTDKYIEYTTDFHNVSDAKSRYCEEKGGCGMNMVFRKYISGEFKDLVAVYHFTNKEKPEFMQSFGDSFETGENSTFNKLRLQYLEQNKNHYKNNSEFDYID